MQIVKYEINRNSLIVGFKVDNFVVYSQISYDETKSKEELLQLAYIQVKPSIDYEKTLDSHSFITDEDGEEFVPNESIVSNLKLLVENDYIQFEEEQEFKDVQLSVIIKDQYNDDMNVEVELITSLGEIENNILSIPNVEEYKEITVSVKIGDLIDSCIIHTYPYEEPELDKVEVLDSRVTNLEQTIDIILEGDVIE